MKNTSKDKEVIYLFNAYSNLDNKVSFISGSDRVGLKLIENEKDEVVVIAPDNFKNLLNDSKVKFISSDSVKIKNLYFRYIIRTFNSILILFKIEKKSKSITIVSTSDFFPDVVPAFIYSFKFKWYAFTYHLYPFDKNFRNFFGRFLQLISYFLFQFSNKVVTTSSECENFLKKNFRIRRLIKIPLGIDLDLYLGNPSKNNDLVYLGRIKREKGIYELPEVVFNLKKYFPSIKLKIIGNGSESDLKILLNLIETYNLKNNVFIYSNLSDTEVIESLKSSRILLQPSFEEGFGLSILEALASNLKIVAYNLPVYKEHFSKFPICYAQKGDKIEFFGHVKVCLEDSQSVEYDIQKFEPFSWKNIFSKIFID